MAGTSVCQHYGEGRNGTLCSTSKIKFDKVPGVEAKTSSNEERGGGVLIKSKVVATSMFTMNVFFLSKT